MDEESKLVPTSKPAPDNSGAKKNWKDERSLKKDGHMEVSLKAKYDPRKCMSRHSAHILMQTFVANQRAIQMQQLRLPWCTMRTTISCQKFVCVNGLRVIHTRSCESYVDG